MRIIMDANLHNRLHLDAQTFETPETARAAILGFAKAAAIIWPELQDMVDLLLADQ